MNRSHSTLGRCGVQQQKLLKLFRHIHAGTHHKAFLASGGYNPIVVDGKKGVSMLSKPNKKLRRPLWNLPTIISARILPLKNIVMRGEVD